MPEAKNVYKSQKNVKPKKTSGPRKIFALYNVNCKYVLMMESLENAGFDINNPNHIIIFGGNYLGLSDYEVHEYLQHQTLPIIQTEECLKFWNSIPMERKISLLGRYEDLINLTATYHKITPAMKDRGVELILRSLAHLSTDKELKDLLAKAKELDVELAPTCGENDVNGLYSRFGEVNFIDSLICGRVQNNALLRAYMTSCGNYITIGNVIFVNGWIPATFNEFNSNYVERKQKEPGTKPFLSQYYGVSALPDRITSKRFLYNKNWQNASVRDWISARWFHRREMERDKILIMNYKIFNAEIEYNEYRLCTVFNVSEEVWNQFYDSYLVKMLVILDAQMSRINKQYGTNVNSVLQEIVEEHDAKELEMEMGEETISIDDDPFA